MNKRTKIPVHRDVFAEKCASEAAETSVYRNTLLALLLMARNWGEEHGVTFNCNEVELLRAFGIEVVDDCAPASMRQPKEGAAT